MEHLIYVLWHDQWKPWLIARLIDFGYILLATGVVLGIGIGWIGLTIYVGRLIGD